VKTRVINEEGKQSKESLVVVRDDFWASTSNEQLNFRQHVKSLLKIHGRHRGAGQRVV
jgi:type I restriction enzyme M protein